MSAKKSVRKDLRLSKDLTADIKLFCREKNIESEAELIRTAIVKYIYSDDNVFKLQGIKTIEASIRELNDKVDVLFRFVRHSNMLMLAYHPEIPDDLKTAAAASARQRDEKSFKNFTDSLKNGSPDFFERLLHTYYTDT